MLITGVNSPPTPAFFLLRSAVFRLIRLTFLAGGSWTVDNSIKWWYACCRGTTHYPATVLNHHGTPTSMCSVEIEDEEVYISFVCILNLLEA